MRPLCSYIATIPLTKDAFARVLLKTERGRFPLAQPYTAPAGGLSIMPVRPNAGLRGARCTGAGEGPPVCIRWFQEALAQAEPEGPKLFGNRGGAPKGERARSKGSRWPRFSLAKPGRVEPRRAPH